MFGPKIWLAMSVTNLVMAVFNMYYLQNMPSFLINAVAAIICALVMLIKSEKGDDREAD